MKEVRLKSVLCGAIAIAYCFLGKVSFTLTAFCVAGTLILCSCREKPPRLLLGGSGWNKIVMLDKNTKSVVWEHPLEAGTECNSVASAPGGCILYAYSKGARLITEDQRELWHISAPPGAEMQTASVLDDGRFLLAWCGHPAVILEVNAQGEVLSRTEYETGIERPHAQFRQVTKNSRGNYMMPLFAGSELREISPEGKMLKAVETGGTPFVARELSNGHFLVAGGDGHFYQELDFTAGETVSRVNSGDIAGIDFFFVAGLVPQPDGHLYICNWQGHGRKKDGNACPSLIETDRDGRPVWQLDDPAFRLVSTVDVVK